MVTLVGGSRPRSGGTETRDGGLLRDADASNEGDRVLANCCEGGREANGVSGRENDLSDEGPLAWVVLRAGMSISWFRVAASPGFALALLSAACGDASGTAATTDDELIQKATFFCEADDACAKEAAIGYCPSGIQVTVSSKTKGSIRIDRYSAIRDEGRGVLDAPLTKVSRTLRSLSAEWDSGEGRLATTLDKSTQIYRGSLVIDGSSFAVQCTLQGQDPCVRVATDGTYCGDSLTTDPSKTSTLFTCTRGETSKSAVCARGCGGGIADIDGADRCL